MQSEFTLYILILIKFKFITFQNLNFLHLKMHGLFHYFI